MDIWALQFACRCAGWLLLSWEMHSLCKRGRFNPAQPFSWGAAYGVLPAVGTRVVAAGQFLHRYRLGLLAPSLRASTLLVWLASWVGTSRKGKQEQEGKGFVSGCLLSLCWPAAWPHELPCGHRGGALARTGILAACSPAGPSTVVNVTPGSGKRCCAGSLL